MTEAKEFHSEAEARAAVDQAVREGEAERGRVSGPRTGMGGRFVWFAHIERGGTSWCIRA